MSSLIKLFFSAYCESIVKPYYCSIMKTSTIISLLTIVTHVKTYNILAVFPLPARSIFGTFKPLMKALVLKGHQVTVLTHFTIGENITGYKEIILEGDILSETNRWTSPYTTKKKQLMKQRLFPAILSDLSQSICDSIFTNKEVIDLLNQNTTYNVVILHVFQTESIYQFAKIFRSSVIGFHSTAMVSWTAGRFALPLNPAVVPNNFLPMGGEMSFWERMENAFVTWAHLLYYYTVMLPRDKIVVEKYFGVGETIGFDELISNTSLFMVNTHFSVNLPRLLLPNVIEVGGIHIGTPMRVSKDIEKWINESKHGVIYFSFGSLVKGHTMPAEKRQAFINAFKRLPQRVIWKWENETMEGKTDNILIGKWMPQFDILSHPNVKAFISHGGLLGTFEAVHCGVPVLVMPQFGDQHTNAKAIESVGGGEILYLSDATEEKIYTALKKILSPSFQEQAKELSERFRDRPMSPLDTAIYWVEYVARHKGAHFMKTAAVGMPFYQYYLLDVIGFILAVLIIFLYVSYLILRFLFRLVFKPKHSSSKKVKKS